MLVNNAAHDERHKFDTVTPEYWDDRMAVNLRHQFFAAQAVHPMMKAAGGGSIINFGSTSWMIGQGGMPGYTAAKAAIMGLTRGLARDFGPDNIRVNSIAPGWIMTERQVSLWLDEAGERELMTRQCLKRKLYPDDMARIVLFLAADDSSAMTNQTYVATAAGCELCRASLRPARFGLPRSAPLLRARFVARPRPSAEMLASITRPPGGEAAARHRSFD